MWTPTPRVRSRRSGARRPARLAALLVALLAAACGRSAPVYEVHGVVKEVLREDRQLLIAHDDVPGLMPPMTMSFDVADPALLDRVAAGDTVHFELEVAEGRYRILAIGRVGEERTNRGATSAPTPASLRGRDDVAPEFSLVDQEGRPVTLASLRGHAVVLDFIFTSCPGPCPILTSKQVTLQRRLAPAERARTRFVSITLDPERDTPEALKRYALARGADLADWAFLTGPPADVERVVKAYGVGTLRKPDGNIEHVVATFLIDGEGRIAKRYLGLEHEPEAIERDLAAVAARLAPPAPAAGEAPDPG